MPMFTSNVQTKQKIFCNQDQFAKPQFLSLILYYINEYSSFCIVCYWFSSYKTKIFHKQSIGRKMIVLRGCTEYFFFSLLFIFSFLLFVLTLKFSLTSICQRFSIKLLKTFLPHREKNTTHITYSNFKKIFD